MSIKFFLCPICGNLVLMLQDSGVTPHCCGDEMTELVPIETDGAGEKHLPVLKRLDDCKVRVEVGATPHPMTEEHHIKFIILETECGFRVRYMKPDAPAVAEFCACGEKIKAVYEFCNLHGLWKSVVNESSGKENCQTGHCSK